MIRIINVLVLLIFSDCLSGQTTAYNNPRDLFQEFTIEVKGNLKVPLETGITIHEGDYVFIRALGEIYLGKDKDKSFAFGKKLPYSGFRKYPNEKFGCLLLLNSKGVAYQSIGRNNSSYFSFRKIPGENWVREIDQFYVPCKYFIADATTPLIFDVNDNQTDDNTGSYIVKIIIIKFNSHINRNAFNNCPSKEPEKKSGIFMDCNDKKWEYEGLLGGWYHGMMNSAYRGLADNPGCQCVYNGGKLIAESDSDYHMGSFDIGYWIFQGNINSPEANFYHVILDVIPHDLFADKIGKENQIYKGQKTYCGYSNTLFLFDVSGSMSANNKWANTKQAAVSTIDLLFDQANNNNKTPSVGLMSYSGECVDNPTNKLLDFSTDKNIIKNAINNNLPGPGGGTPTPQAIKNAEAFLKQQLQANNQCEGDLIILTDGQSSCGVIRPPGTYSITTKSKVYTSCQPASGNFQMRYQTIGFDIPPGSDAEKDLQYLASTHGGRYFHADNAAELIKAFEKIARVFVPIENVQSASKVLPAENASFKAGVDLIKSKNYDTAFAIFKKFNEKYPDDSAGIYNYAQMSEATDQYQLAAVNYSKYIEQNPQVYNKLQIEATITKMNEYYREYFDYQKKVIRNDLAFIKEHFQKLMNGQSIPLANEFTGFIKEKSVLYDKLPAIFGTNDPQFTNLCKEIINGFKTAQRRINSNAKSWDQDAVPVISVLYLKVEKLAAIVENLQPQ